MIKRITRLWIIPEPRIFYTVKSMMISNLLTWSNKYRWVIWEGHISAPHITRVWIPIWKITDFPRQYLFWCRVVSPFHFDTLFNWWGDMRIWRSLSIIHIQWCIILLSEVFARIFRILKNHITSVPSKDLSNNNEGIHNNNGRLASSSP